MSTVTVIRAVDCLAVPWKNGGGTTLEIAVFPPGASMDDFLWRLSMAKVTAPGSFSLFPGINRTLAVLEGTLALSGKGIDAQLDSRSAPAEFDGGIAVYGQPVGRPVLDLNAMARRSHHAVRMSRLTLGMQTPSAGFLVALAPQTVSSHQLDTHDCVKYAEPILAGGPAIIVTFTGRI
ncbi:HutD family protein [Novosphingobium sp. AP12]|uniref:HutD/Ves family protein n=1 Tax=Novosphingobium sp. AP12 TaxID=1144305 RepID=UPI00055C809C|nr:HutD family protein [Novosphingobium sp. AP12]